MALTLERLTRFAGVVPARGTYPIAANVRIFKGAMVAIDSAGRARPAGLISAGALAGIGKSSATYDNRTGSELGGGAGAVDVEVEYGVFEWDLDESDPPTKPGVVFMVDDHTVSDDNDTDARAIAGFCTEIRNGRAYTWMGPHVEGMIVLAASEATQLDTAQADIVALEGDVADLLVAGNRTYAVSAPIPERLADDEFELPIEIVAHAGTVTAAHVALNDSVTGDNTNTASFILVRYRAGVRAVIATLDLVATAGDVVAFVPKSMGSLTNATLAADDVLVLEATEGGDGLVTAAGAVTVRIAQTLQTA